MTNFDFFDLITWDFLMVWAWNLVCGRFTSLRKSRKFWLYWRLVALVIIIYEKFHKCTCQSHLTECSHMGNANFPGNAATAKQCQVVSLTFIATEWFFQAKICKGFFNISERPVAARWNLTAKNVVSVQLV